MAATVSGSDPLAQTHWAKYVTHQMFKRITLLRPENGLCGEGHGYVIRKRLDLSKDNSGDTVRVPMLRTLDAAPIINDEELSGRESSQSWDYHDMTLGAWRTGVKVESPQSQQRVNFNLVKQHVDAMVHSQSVWWEIALLNHAAGYTAATGSDKHRIGSTQILGSARHSLLTAPHAPTSQRWHRVGDKASDANVASDSSAILSVDEIRELALNASLMSNPLIPIRLKGSGVDVYLLLVHPLGLNDLGKSGSDMHAMWHSAMQGGSIADNPLLINTSGAVGGVLLVPCPWLPPGVGTSSEALNNTRRAVLVGQDSLAIAFGNGYAKQPFKWSMESRDHNWRKAIGMHSLVTADAPNFEFVAGDGKQDQKLVLTHYVTELS